MGAVIAEIVSFVVILFVLYRYVRPPLKRVLDRQKQTIAQQVTDSEEAKARLAEAERKHSAAVEEARVEAAKIRDNARAEAGRIAEEMQAQADAEVAKIRQRGEDAIRLQRQQMVRELRADLGNRALTQAQDLVRQHLSGREAQAATVDRFLGELEGMSQTRSDATVGSGASRGES